MQDEVDQAAQSKDSSFFPCFLHDAIEAGLKSGFSALSQYFRLACVCLYLQRRPSAWGILSLRAHHNQETLKVSNGLVVVHPQLARRNLEAGDIQRLAYWGKVLWKNINLLTGHCKQTEKKVNQSVVGRRRPAGQNKGPAGWAGSECRFEEQVWCSQQRAWSHKGHPIKSSQSAGWQVQEPVWEGAQISRSSKRAGGKSWAFRENFSLLSKCP